MARTALNSGLAAWPGVETPQTALWPSRALASGQAKPVTNYSNSGDD